MRTPYQPQAIAICSQEVKDSFGILIGNCMKPLDHSGRHSHLYTPSPYLEKNPNTPTTHRKEVKKMPKETTDKSVSTAFNRIGETKNKVRFEQVSGVDWGLTVYITKTLDSKLGSPQTLNITLEVV